MSVQNLSEPETLYLRTTKNENTVIEKTETRLQPRLTKKASRVREHR